MLLRRSAGGKALGLLTMTSWPFCIWTLHSAREPQPRCCIPGSLREGLGPAAAMHLTHSLAALQGPLKEARAPSRPPCAHRKAPAGVRS